MPSKCCLHAESKVLSRIWRTMFPATFTPSMPESAFSAVIFASYLDFTPSRISSLMPSMLRRVSTLAILPSAPLPKSARNLEAARSPSHSPLSGKNLSRMPFTTP